MMRFCPNCETERSLSETFCDGEIDGTACGWVLSGLPIQPEGWRPAHNPPQSAAVSTLCRNGHAVDSGDLLCPTCGSDVLANSPAGAASGDGASVSRGEELRNDTQTAPVTETVVAGWPLLKRLPTTSQVLERYETVREADGRAALLTLYSNGSEPDPEVYEVLRTLDRDHVPEILETGRWHDRAYEVSEDLRGGTLADLGNIASDTATLSTILREVGGALAAIAERGLRHRDLKPGAVVVRSRAPLDLVVTGFGSARLSEYDLDIVSPLEITRYTAPEAVAGGVAAASDWWSLGMLLLEQVTRGECFADADDQSFLISVLTNGAPIPPGLPPELDVLLRGLLALDRRSRWCWPEVQRWLAGDAPEAPVAVRLSDDEKGRRSIQLGDTRYASPARFALAAAEAVYWDQARAILLRGELATWLEESGQHASLRAEVRSIAVLEDVSEDMRLSLALKALNPSMPLVVRGEIVTPGWLIEHPDEGYALITGPIPDRLERNDEEVWLARLKRREAAVRERARQLEIELDESQIRVTALSTSKSRLAALWDEKRRILPDTDHPGLLALVERKVSEEDLILLLSAAPSQFRAVDAIVDEAAEAASRAGLTAFDRNAALERTCRPRREIHQEIEKRLEGFARCGHDRIDEWGDQFRLERRLPLARALALLAVPPNQWRQPPRQAYVAALLDFYARRITTSIMRGPLTRMVIGKTTARLDLTELNSARRSSTALLDHLLLRNDQTIEIDPAALTEDPRVERRLRTLYTQATLYRRDTGIDGLYLGFPFLVMQQAKASTRPRIAPILLWPIKLRPEVGSRGRVTLAFDRDREEVRLNPAFESLFGIDGTSRWREIANEILSRASVTATEVVEAFSELGRIDGTTIKALPSKDLRLAPGDDRIACAAALFHLAFLGQAVMEDLRQLKTLPPSGSSLETAFRIGEVIRRADRPVIPERERYFTSECDPSQESAVLEARASRGLLVEGPPGTGKSQTIVNMVADAIGTGRSLLVVCQKQAALEVVNKRLEAAGLGERIVMVNDVNKDREPVIRTIREQIEALFERREPSPAWKHQRQQLAARIEALEGDLDSQHRGLYARDKETGLSYRQILGALITLRREGAMPSLPTLRHVLSEADPGRIAGLQEVCAPIARLWLSAHFENSPLAVTRPFASDEGTIQVFREHLATFSQVEAQRLEVLESTPSALAVNEPDLYRSWLTAHGKALLDLASDAREELGRWLDNLIGISEREPNSTPVQKEMAALERALLELPADEATAESIEIARRMDDGALSEWTETSDRLLRTPTFFQRLSPSRWLARRRWQALLNQEGLSDPKGFNAALHREISLRPLRDRLIQAASQIGDATGELPAKRIPDLIAYVRSSTARLAAAESLVRRLEAYPDRTAAYTMARAADRKAVEDLLESLEQGLARHASKARSASALEQLRPWLTDEWIDGSFRAINSDGSNAARLEAIGGSFPYLAAYLRFRARVPQLPSEAFDVFTQLARIRGNLEALSEDELGPTVRRIIATEAHMAWKARLEGAEPALLLEAGELKTKAEALSRAIREMRALNRVLLVQGISASDLKPLGEWEDITRLRGVRAKRLREFVDRGADLGLMRLRPVWLVNPDVASRLLPLRKALFDTVIFDEASQMPVEYALPSLYRSAAMIVSGDEKQMPPTAFFSSRVEDDEAQMFEGQSAEDDLPPEERAEVEETWNRREIKDCPDLLQLAKSVLPAKTLQIHYRSTYRELIQFSNASFYVNGLSVPARHPAEEIKRKRPIELIPVNGVYVDQTNPAEAEKVVDVLANLWGKANGTAPTIGVVTFNRKQADLIEEVLEARAEADASFRVAITRERERIESGEDMGFFVKNVENVQGDERDIMVFSSTFGRNAQGTFRRNFGVLGQAGGERRLNVAVTRAKQKVILITSMPIREISGFIEDRGSARSPRDFLQAYFEYARTISEGDLPAANALLSRLASEQRRSRNTHTGEGDGLELAIRDEIRALGWEPSAVKDNGAFDLDFAIEDPRTGLYGIGIECDAPTHHLLETARAREMWRPMLLRRSIPVIHRVSSHRWFHEPETERRLLRNAVTSALGARA